MEWAETQTICLIQRVEYPVKAGAFWRCRDMRHIGDTLNFRSNYLMSAATQIREDERSNRERFILKTA
jgi:hypothetical protein